MILAVAGLAHGPVAAITSTSTPDFEEMCDAVLSRAISFTEQRCGDTGRNEACYGYNRVVAEFQPDADPSRTRFEAVGDIVPVRSLARIQTQGLNLEEATWGMAVLKLQANLPNTNPGQNVTFILYGNTSLVPAAGQTNAFYLSTELGELSCNQLPSSSLVVRAPGHVEVAFTLNNVQIRLASTLALTAADSNLQVQVLEGHASITANEQTQTMVAGQELAVPLDPVTGDAAGAPSEPATFEHEPVMDNVSALADAASGETLDGPITVEGPIELIDRERGWITVDGRRIKLAPEEIEGLEVGQPFRFSGYARGFVVVKLPPGVRPTSGGRVPTETLGAIWNTLVPETPSGGAPTRISSRTPSLTATPTLTPSATATATDTDTPTRTPSLTPSDTETPTRTPSDTPDPTATPTRTPSDTPEPTNTPRPPTNTPIPPTATDTPVPPLAPLSLAALCSPDPASYRVWSVNNPNPVDVAFSWNVRHSTMGQSGGGVAPASGSAGFTTTTEQNSNTVEIWANGALNDSHSGNADACE
ncbi:MAG: hypothetical protein IT323_08920 [Anaerolineae bacterium]|nr:hypothetical protein [Anaerolineae bacterium]